MLGISKKYLRFFVNTVNDRALLIQGSRRSSKSFSVYKWLHFLSSGSERLVNYIVTDTYPALQNAIDDFQRATGLMVEGSQTIGLHADMPNGSRFVFKAYDDPTKAQGTSMDYLFVDEALRVDPRIIKVLSLSVRKQLIFAYNPTKKSELDDWLKPDKSNFLHTTWQDNDWLTPEQKEFFRMLKEKAEKPNASLYDIFAYKCYYLGEESDMTGKCFSNLAYCTYDDYLAVPAEEAASMDMAFGGADRMAIVGCKLYQNRLYVHSYYYGIGTLKPEEVAMRLYECGFNAETPIMVDYGGVARMVLNDVVSAGNGTWTDFRIANGFSLFNAPKGPIMEGITMMMSLDAIVIDDSSPSTREEFEKIELTEEHKLKGKDHAVDAVRYAATWLKMTT